jgi:histidine triad (HIT) family protein
MEKKMNCIFCKIIAGEIPSDKVLETDEILAFRDINPVAPEHILIVPKKHIQYLEDAAGSDVEILGNLFLTARDIAKLLSIEKNGYRLILNNGKAAGQEVLHIHLHLLGGKENLGPMLTR